MFGLRPEHVIILLVIIIVVYLLATKSKGKKKVNSGGYAMSASGDLLVQRLEQLYERKLIPWEAYKKAVGHAKDAGELMDQNDTDAYFDLLRLRDSLRWLTDRDPEIMAFYEYVIQLSERYKL